MELLNIMDYERAALELLPTMVGDYYRSGARDETTLARNRAAFAEVALRYKVLVDISTRTTATTVLGQAVSMPVLVAPTAFHRLAHNDGEVGTARAAGAAGTIMMLSTLSNTAVEEVAAATSGPLWFQLYVYRDRGATKALVERVAAAGCKALVVTADAAILGTRERDVRNRFNLPAHLDMPNATADGLKRLPSDGADSGLAAYVAESLDPTLSWKDLEWLASISDLPLVLKGVVRGDDAARSLDFGAQAVVVSNHGGRQLDGAVSTLEVLPEVIEAIDGRCEVLIDGGVRRGTDVLKALCLGARAVGVGRPVLWGLSVGGSAGVQQVLELLRAELDEAMALCGCLSPGAAGPDFVRVGGGMLAKRL